MSEVVARVVPDIAGLEGEFDYRVPEQFVERVGVGTQVRVTLNGRRVRAWVINPRSSAPEGKRLLDINKVSGLGPDQELIDLASWAAWRWAGKRSHWLQTASSPRFVHSLPTSVSRDTGKSVLDARWFHAESTVLRWPPSEDPLDVVLEADDLGPSLILVPSPKAAERLAQRLRQAGRRVALHPEQWPTAAAGNVTVVGSMTAAWAPMPHLASILVLDAHDESYRAEGAPTWDAVAVVAERAARRGVPLTLLSSVPRVEHLEGRRLQTVDRAVERNGWAKTVIVDQRHSDPRQGLYSKPFVDLVRSGRRVLCVLNRKGRAATLVCTQCDELARCETCNGPQVIDQHDHLHCKRCRTDQPTLCRHCGAMRFKQLRLGVSRVREELEALTGKAVGEVTAETDGLPDTEVIIGTEAVLHRVGRADAVVFVDFDQELLASRIRTNEHALGLLARASRIVRGHAGMIVLQTRQPEHEVVQAALHADPSLLSTRESARRHVLGWPPFKAIATVAGPNAQQFVDQAPLGVTFMGEDDGKFLLRADSPTLLSDGLAQMKRPGGRLAVQVDPYRV